MNALEHGKSWLRRFDFFALGPSALAFYAFIFFCVPLLGILGVRFGLALDGGVPTLRPLFYLLLGFGSLALGYYAVPVWRSRSITDFFRRPWDEGRTKIIFAAGFGLGLLMKALRLATGTYAHLGPQSALQSGPFFSSVGFLEEFAYLALAIASAKQAGAETARERKFWGWALGLSLGTELLYAVPSCARLGIFAPLLIWFIVRWYSGRRSYASLGLLPVFIILILPFGNVCRTPSIWLNSYAPSVPGGGAGIPAFVSDSVFSRMSQEKVFAAILAHPVPWLQGRFLRDIAVSLGPPRFIWESKPAIAAGGNELGHRLGLLSPADMTTSIGPTLPGDWYMNFGLGGLLFGMALMGMLWRFIYVHLIRLTGLSLAGVVLYALVWVQVIRGIEDSIAPVYAGLIKFTVAFLLISIFAQKRAHSLKSI